MSQLADYPSIALNTNSGLRDSIYGSNSGRQVMPANDGSTLSVTAWAVTPSGGTTLPDFLTQNDELGIFSQTTREGRQAGSSVIAWSTEGAALQKQLQKMDLRTRAELRALSASVAAIAKSVEISVKQTSVSSASVERNFLVRDEHISASTDPDSLSEVLNRIADDSDWANIENASLIADNLENDNPSVRSAAGRAFAAVDPEVARTILPTLIEREKNRFVRATLDGALAAIS